MYIIYTWHNSSKILSWIRMDSKQTSSNSSNKASQPDIYRRSRKQEIRELDT